MSETRRVLVVDDSPDQRDSLCRLLELYGHTAQGAEDGLDGAARALAWRPDVAVVDLDMPVVDGYGMARRVREAMGGSVRLIAVTGLGDRGRSLEAGFDEHLEKPADPDVLMGLVRGRG